MAGSDYLPVQIGFLANRLLLNLAVLSWAGDGGWGGLVKSLLLVWIAYLFLASVEAVLRRGYWSGAVEG